ncbi:MAG: TFIIB-type zinc ribbon-containing protein [Planctomycetota bacterium]|jgi:hypothetical protein
MVFSLIFGEKCTRCGAKRTKKEFEGLPTCDKCEMNIKVEREEKRPCPMCASTMEKHVVLNVIIDKCPTGHGAWLDAGELDLLKKAVSADSGGQFATGMVLGMVIG